MSDVAESGFGTLFGVYGDVRASLRDDGVASVELCRPPDNYFDRELIASLADALDALDAEPRARVSVLRSQGKHFCAGANFGGRNPLDTTGRHLYDEALRVFSCRKPVVAAVQGAAIGGGLGVALAADFRIATPESRFSANFARLAFHPGFAISVTLPAVVGQQRALELLYTGRRVGGEEALRIGLCDALVPMDQLVPRAHAFAREIALSGPLAVESIRVTQRGDLAERARIAMVRERAEQERLQRSSDFKEGIAAMAARREPRFTRS